MEYDLKFAVLAARYLHGTCRFWIDRNSTLTDKGSTMPNGGTVSNLDNKVDVFDYPNSSAVKRSGCSRWWSENIYCRVLNAFNLANFDPFDEFYGTSAGALGYQRVSLPPKRPRTKIFITELTHYLSFPPFQFSVKKQYMDLDWALEKKVSHFKMDIDMGHGALGSRKAMAAVTSSLTLSSRYYPMLGGNWKDVMRATCAIPNLYPKQVRVEQ